MNINLILHFFRHAIQLKKQSYKLYFLTLVGLFFFSLFVRHFYPVGFLKSIAVGSSIVFPFILLSPSFLIPSGAQGVVKFQSAGYSWGYALTTFRSRKDYLFAVVAELVLDCILCIGMMSVSFIIFSHEVLLAVMAMCPFAFYTLRFTKFSSIRNANGRSAEKKDQSKSSLKSFLISIVIAVLIILLDVPAQLITTALVPIVLGFYAYSPFLTMHALSTDLNKEERSKLNFKYSIATLFMILLGGFYFYFVEIKSGNQIFSEINSANNSKVKKIIIKDKSLLNLKGPKYGQTPLLFAAKVDNAELVKWMLQNGGNVNDLDNTGNNILNFTASNCNLELTEIVINKGVNIKNIPKNNMNALFSAASSNCEVLIRYFKKIGMDENKVNQKGQNYIEYGKATNSRFEKVIDFIEKYGL